MSRLPLELLEESRACLARKRSHIRSEDEAVRVIDALDIQRLGCAEKDLRVGPISKEEVLHNNLELRGCRDARAHNRLIIPP